MDKEVVTPAAIRQVLIDYWREYKRNRTSTVLGFLFPAIGNILVFFVPPLIIARLVDDFVARGTIDLSGAMTAIIWFGVLWFLGEVCWRIGIWFLVRLEHQAIKDLARLVFRRLAERDYAFYANHFVGSLTKKGISFSRNFELFTDTLAFSIVINIIPLIFAVVILWGYSPWIPLALIGWILLAVLIGVPIIRGRSRLVALRHDASSKMSGRLSDSISNILAVKSFAAEEEELKAYGKYVDTFADRFKKAADYQNLRFETVISPLYVMANVTGLILAIYFAQKFSFQPGMIVVVFSYYVQGSRLLWEVNKVYRQIESSINEAAEFAQLFIDPPEVLDVPRAKSLKITKAKIEFKDVNFRYEDQADEVRPFLDNFSLTVSGRQRVGLVGPSGSGKTTITKLLLRFIDLQEGTIEIDGQDISKVTQTSLRQMIAYVPQEPLLFHRTLLENIAYGLGEVSEKEVIKAAKLAHAHEFISQLPKGYQTLVGERGVKLSGGQRQRVAIARAILKNAPILVLDEATSSLDSESEKYIQDGLKQLMKGKTVIVIAHRLSTIKHLDRVVVIKKGEVVQDGTHDKLVKEKGLYSTLWKHQSGGFLGD